MKNKVIKSNHQLLKKMDILKLVKEWAKQNKWMELDILRQRLDYVDDFHIIANIAKKYRLSEEKLKDSIESVLNKEVFNTIKRKGIRDRLIRFKSLASYSDKLFSTDFYKLKPNFWTFIKMLTSCNHKEYFL